MHTKEEHSGDRIVHRAKKATARNTTANDVGSFNELELQLMLPLSKNFRHSTNSPHQPHTQTFREKLVPLQNNIQLPHHRNVHRNPHLHIHHRIRHHQRPALRRLAPHQAARLLHLLEQALKERARQRCLPRNRHHQVDLQRRHRPGGQAGGTLRTPNPSTPQFPPVLPRCPSARTEYIYVY